MCDNKALGERCAGPSHCYCCCFRFYFVYRSLFSSRCLRVCVCLFFSFAFNQYKTKTKQQQQNHRKQSDKLLMVTNYWILGYSIFRASISFCLIIHQKGFKLVHQVEKHIYLGRAAFWLKPRDAWRSVKSNAKKTETANKSSSKMRWHAWKILFIVTHQFPIILPLSFASSL